MMDDTLPARVAIVGAGAMGSGIALSFARGGSRCTLIEPALSRAEQALDGLREIVADHVADGLLPEDEAAAMTDRIGIAELAGEGGGFDGAALVVEAVTEDPDVKADVYRLIESEAPDDVVIASNTSAIPIHRLAEGLRRPERFLGTHWFLPTLWVPCVEIIPTPATDPAVTERVVRWHERLGKLVVVVADSAGFVGNRLQFALFAEAARIVEEGLATPDEVDAVVRSSFGYRLPFYGPFRMADMAGLDVYAGAFAALERDLGGRFAAPAALTEAVALGRLGAKSGQGLLEWTPESRRRVYRERNRSYARLREIWSADR